MPLSTIDQTGLNQSQILSAINMPTGSVVQVVQATQTVSAISTSSSTFVTTGVTASITPQFSTSKILVLFNTPDLSGSAAAQINATIYRGSNNLAGSNTYSSFINIFVQSGGQFYIPGSICYLDSPATTSSVTYTVYFANQSNNGTIYMNRSGGSDTSAFTLMEIR